MILLELEIEDYKQFRGKHLFTPTPNGVIAIIGQNGAGKTTLFEAIEWCLYQPREIRSDEIPPRGAQELRPRVRIRFTNPNTGATHEIERTLKKTGASAEIRQIDESSHTIIATGSTTVSNYAATRLIGLEHKAFVATFFTRQKELSFFGALKPTERRREVGRLLGLETIRNAQELIAEERVAKRSLAQGLLAQYNQESGERDFDAERTGLREQLTDIDKQITEAATALIGAEQIFRSATAARALLVEQRESTLKLQSELAKHLAAITAAETAISTASAELAGLDRLDAERTSLLEPASKIAEHESRVAALELDRDKHQRRQALIDQQHVAAAEHARLLDSAHVLVVSMRSCLGTGHSLAEIAPLDEIDQTLDATATIRASDSEQLLHQLQALATDQAALAALEANLTKYQSKVAEFEERRQAILALGNPLDAEQSSADQRDNALQTIAMHRAGIKAHTASLADYRHFASRDHDSLTDAICPTCGRQVTPEDEALTRKHASRRIAEIEAQIATLQDETTRQESRIAAIELDLAEIRARSDNLATLSERIANGQQTIKDTDAQLRTARTALDEQMVALDRTTPVTDDELAGLRTRLTNEREIEQSRNSLAQVRASIATSLDRSESLATQIASIGETHFDPAAFQQAQSDLRAARDASTRISSIDQQLVRRPEHTTAIATATAQRAASQSEAERLEAEIAANPIDEFALDKADLEVEQARQRAQQVRSQRETHQRVRITIEQALKQIEADQKRLKAIASRADQARVEADDLDRMYKEFNHFEQYVARRVRPQLEDMTSELVRVITENKYESVELDDDYGVQVWDGELGPYPIEHFSGGERDVIALSARLALSRLIGSQAANPPSFLVLDEVFGSLDRDRRGNVLDLLSSLAGSAESFQQLFVISHVDDVRLSPAFNEIWRVAELEDGCSRLENLNLSQGVEDL